MAGLTLKPIIVRTKGPESNPTDVRACVLLITDSLRLGEELQHDTSPHEVELAGRKRKVQTASAVLCYSRMLFFQCYPTFQRFDCKVFLTEALRYLGGAPA